MPRHPASQRRSIAWARLHAALFASVVLALTQGVAGRIGAAPVTIGGPFDLVDADGHAVTERTYAGQWLLVYFGYTHCPNSCPTALLDVSVALNQLGARAAKLQPLFITIDPRRDTPSVMRDYVGSFDRRIVGLTGTEPQIAKVAGEYGAYYAAQRTGPDDYAMDHSTYLYLMDPRGQFVRGFDGDIAGERLAESLRALLDASDHRAAPR